MSKLTCNIKTRKDPGLIVPRLIHSYPAHVFSSGMRVIAQQLKPLMYKHEHMLIVSQHLIFPARIVVDERDGLFQDRREGFFMSVDHHDLARWSIVNSQRN